MRSYKSTDKMCRRFTCTDSKIANFCWIPPAWNTIASCFYPPKSEYQYTVYFIRGVDNTLTEFDAKAVINRSCCRLDIPIDWASCVICELNGT